MKISVIVELGELLLHIALRFNLSEVNELIRSRRTIYPEQFSTRKVHKEQIE